MLGHNYEHQCWHFPVHMHIYTRIYTHTHVYVILCIYVYTFEYGGHDEGPQRKWYQTWGWMASNAMIYLEFFLNTSPVRCFVWWWQDVVTSTEWYSFLHPLTEYLPQGHPSRCCDDSKAVKQGWPLKMPYYCKGQSSLFQNNFPYPLLKSVSLYSSSSSINWVNEVWRRNMTPSFQELVLNVLEKVSFKIINSSQAEDTLL